MKNLREGFCLKSSSTDNHFKFQSFKVCLNLVPKSDLIIIVLKHSRLSLFQFFKSLLNKILVSGIGQHTDSTFIILNIFM